MKISIIIINQKCITDLQQTINSLLFQSDNNFDIVIVDSSGTNNETEICSLTNCTYISENPKFSFYQLANIGISKTIGDYCIFLSGGEQLADDHAVEELYLNQLDRDIIFCNLISNETVGEEKPFIYKKIAASSLILDTVSLKCAVIKRSILLELYFFDEKMEEIASWCFFVESILAHGKTFKHINMFLTICMMNNAINNVKILPAFEEKLKKILPEILPMYAQEFIDYKNCTEIRDSDAYLVLSKFAKTFFFRTFMSIRTFCMKHGIYYEQKAYIRKKMLYRQIKRQDKKTRKIVDRKIVVLPYNILQRSLNNDEDIIVSLTSYGYRVINSVPYAIYSLFTQTVLPNRIILYLGENEWNENNIPESLKRLKLSGLEIVYCEDLKSYKKLIPAIAKFPNNTIITFDDDVYYTKETIEELISEYKQSDRRTVICHRGAVVERRCGEFLAYNKWKDYVYGNKYSLYSPIGVNGVLYPGGVFDKEILNKEIFMKYAPFADDLWFWLMSYKLGLKIINVENTSQEKNLNVDTMEQLIRENSTALNFINFVDGANDTQFKLLLDYYGLK